ncbi:MAG: hypothetical protein WBN31_12795 [Gammaproteobacteria bacterium]
MIAFRRLGLPAAVLALMALMATSQAAAYPVDLDIDTEGLEVTVNRVDVDEAVVLQVHNYETRPIRCNFEFRNGPEVARQRKVSIDASADRVVRWTPGRSVVRVKVSGKCWISEADTENDDKKTAPA